MRQRARRTVVAKDARARCWHVAFRFHHVVRGHHCECHAQGASLPLRTGVKLFKLRPRLPRSRRNNSTQWVFNCSCPHYRTKQYKQFKRLALAGIYETATDRKVNDNDRLSARRRSCLRVTVSTAGEAKPVVGAAVR